MADEDALRAKLERAIRQQAALLELWSVDHESFEERVRHVLRSASITLGVERVSYWSLAGAPDAIRCEALFVRADERFESGAELANSKYPKYFEALRAGRPIVATDAHTHPATSEFSDGYLKPNNIGAMLDVPVYVQGQLAGVVCHEHVGAERNWPDDELLFAMSAAQLISLADESRRRAAAELALRESEARFRSIVEASPVPMLVIGFPDGLVRYGNAAASELVGVPHDSLVGQTTIDYYANPAERAEVLATLGTGGLIRGREILFRRADGSEFWALLSAERLMFDGRPALVAAIWDLTRQKSLEERLRHAALHDALTGLANRALFEGQLRSEIARASRNPGYRFAVLYIDLDGFKRVNDLLGHAVGDAVLGKIAEQLTATIRATDTAARLGGDEFAALVVGFHDASEVDQIAERLREVLRVPYVHDGTEHHVTASIGAVVVDARLQSPDEILKRADAAMYRVKYSTRPPENVGRGAP